MPGFDYVPDLRILDDCLKGKADLHHQKALQLQTKHANREQVREWTMLSVGASVVRGALRATLHNDLPPSTLELFELSIRRMNSPEAQELAVAQLERRYDRGLQTPTGAAYRAIPKARDLLRQAMAIITHKDTPRREILPALFTKKSRKRMSDAFEQRMQQEDSSHCVEVFVEVQRMSLPDIEHAAEKNTKKFFPKGTFPFHPSTMAIAAAHEVQRGYFRTLIAPLEGNIVDDERSNQQEEDSDA